MTKKECWFWLSNVRGVTYTRIKGLLKEFIDIDLLYAASERSIRAFCGEHKYSEEFTTSLLSSRKVETVKESIHRCIEKGIRFITKEEEHYPEKLRQLYDAPFYLYYKGELPDPEKPSIAVIGARNCSVYGQEISACFSKILAQNGISIISGLARGIDGYAHEGALSGNGYTCGVLGFGPDVCYPRENQWLFEKIEVKGGLVSEYSPGTPGLPQHFPMRNRLISGLSDGVFVVEASQHSGTLITCEHALNQGKNIYVVPGRIGDLLSAGCISLLKAGAKPVTEPIDIMEDLPLWTARTQENRYPHVKTSLRKKTEILLETEEKIVYASLDLFPKHMEILLQETGLSAVKLAETVLSLELKGYIYQTQQNYYAAGYRD